MRRRSSSDSIAPADVTPASRSRWACHGARSSVQPTRERSLRAWSASSRSRGSVSVCGFQYGDVDMLRLPP